jgi:hypothetical protein
MSSIWMRRMPSIAWPFAAAALVAVVAGVALSRTHATATPPPSTDVPVSDAMPVPLNDTNAETWTIDAPAPPVMPPTHVRRPAPAPQVDWNALAAGVADVEVHAHAVTARPADLGGDLSPEEARELVANAEAPAPRRGRAHGTIVIARGTPRDHGGCGSNK